MYGIPIPESELPGRIDWKAVIALAKKHVVFGIIIESVQMLPERLRPSGAVAAEMNRFALGLIQTNIILDNTIARLSGFFEQHGIKGVLLKGAGVARYYRQPQMRQSGDIDFYVGNTVFKRAVGLCQNELIKETVLGENEQHFDFYLDGVLIELHRIASRVYSPIRSRRFQRWVVDELEHSAARRTLTVGDTDILLPSYDFDAIFIFYHAWRHFIMGGIGLRQLCDWAMIFHSHGSDIDTERLKANIRRFGITKGWKLFACIAVKHLGVPADAIPLYDPAYEKKSERILADILSGGNFGYYSKANARTPIFGRGLSVGLGKVRNVTEYFVSLFPLIPVEATFLYANRLFFGTISHIRRSRHKSS